MVMMEQLNGDKEGDPNWTEVLATEANSCELFGRIAKGANKRPGKLGENVKYYQLTAVKQVSH